MAMNRRYPIGAELSGEAARFRVWAPKHQNVAVVLESGDAQGEHALTAEADGYFSATVPHAKVGDLYRFRLGGGNQLYPDPMSRYQPSGPHGPSQLVEPAAYRWNDAQWKGAS